MIQRRNCKLNSIRLERYYIGKGIHSCTFPTHVQILVLLRLSQVPPRVIPELRARSESKEPLTVASKSNKQKELNSAKLFNAKKFYFSSYNLPALGRIFSYIYIKSFNHFLRIISQHKISGQ